MKYQHILALSALLPLLAACEDKDSWTPGPSYDTTSQIVMTSPVSTETEISKGDAAETDVVLVREDASKEITVPLTISDAEHFEAPESVTFAKGETEKTVVMKFKPTQEIGQFTCTMTIPHGEFNSPYAAATTSNTLSVLVVEWEVIAENMRIYTANGNLPEQTGTLLKGKGLDVYRIPKLFKDTNFTFGLDGKCDDQYKGAIYMKPKGGLFAESYAWEGYDVWYFGKKANEEEYPLYWPTDPDHYYDYVFVGLKNLYFSTYIVPSENWGTISIYWCLYDLEGTYLTRVYDYIYFVW